MAGKLRHMKTKNGRFYARIAVPKDLRPLIGKSELLEPLGADRREAQRLLPAAVARLQGKLTAVATPRKATALKPTAAPEQQSWSAEQLAVKSYKLRLIQDSELRLSDPAWARVSIDYDYAQELSDGMSGRLSDSALEDLVGHRIEGFRRQGLTSVAYGTLQWREIAMALCASEYEALERLLERDEGNFNGQPSHPILTSLNAPDPTPPVDLMKLWDQYVATRTKVGSMRDGGRRQVVAIKSLAAHARKPNANDLTKKDILNWRDDLLKNVVPSTIAKVYLPTVKSVFRWAVENDLMETNPAEDVRQQTAKASRNREASYTDSEATKQLACASTYQPKRSDTGAVLENKKVTAAKRWIPMLCAHTGARVTELAQLRREDVRQEGDIWVIRITPEAGSVKTNQYRDVPLHKQITSLGFLDYVNTIDSGPLFHMSPKPELNRRYAQKMTNRLRDWLHEAELVPDGLQPFHAWRHRFKTVGLELGIA